MSFASWRKNHEKTARARWVEVKIIPQEDGYFAARLPDLPGIITGGDAPEEALRNAQEALTATLDTMRRRKIPPPPPRHKFSGHFNVKVPVSMHRILARSADEEGVSLNALVTHLLSEALVAEEHRRR